MDSTDPAESHNSAQINRLQSSLAAANAKLLVGETRYEELMKENFSLETILKGYQQESVKATNLTSTLQSQSVPPPSSLPPKLICSNPD